MRVTVEPLEVAAWLRASRADSQSDASATKPRQKQSLLGHRVCQNAYRRIIGFGNSRFFRICQAVARQQPLPIDGRMVSQKHLFASKTNRNREVCVEFLNELYETIAEPMPDATSPHSVGGASFMAFRRNRGRRPHLAAQLINARKKEKQKADESKEKGEIPSGSKIKLLPPGTFSDYLSLLHEKHPDCKPSLKLFNKVTSQLIGQLFTYCVFFSALP